MKTNKRNGKLSRSSKKNKTRKRRSPSIDSNYEPMSKPGSGSVGWGGVKSRKQRKSRKQQKSRKQRK